MDRTVLLLCLVLAWMLPVDSMMVRLDSSSQKAKKPIPLGSANDAVDDMFFGCSPAMKELVQTRFFNKEDKARFADAWKRAKSCAAKKMKHKEAADSALTEDHLQAICLYTSDEDEDEDLSKTFNEAVRSSRRKYGSDFPFHALYFWLTSAVQILSNSQKCHETYRRTELNFAGKVNGVMRFGSFASSSLKSTLVNFGNETCFRIRTCSGAFLKRYSAVIKEEEVLIPPYEMFQITEIKKGRKRTEPVGCKVLYTLQSVGLLSNLNCRSVTV